MAREFSKTRMYVWACVKNFLDHFENKQTKTLIELGCGNGKNLLYAINHGYMSENIHGIDNSESLVNICIKQGLNVSIDDILLIDTTQKYDIVLCVAVLHHLKTHIDRMDAFKNIMSICKDNGSILLTIWSYETEGAKKPREFTKGDNIVMWNNREERFYYIFDKSDWIDFLELNKKIYNFEYKLLWEEQNWVTVIRKN